MTSKADWPEQFHPNLSPKTCIRAGIFGGSYFSRLDLINYKEFPSEWFEGLPTKKYLSPDTDKSVNYYKVKAGTSQGDWEKAGWMHPDDPRGWFQWYCRYWLGRRHADDARQIDRWVNFASPEKGRWTHRLLDQMIAKNTTIDDPKISPVIRQSLIHWAYKPTAADLRARSTYEQI